MKKQWLIAIAVIALVISTWACGSSSETPTEKPAATSVAAETQAPESTQEVKPTDTPEPTDVPEPTAEPKPTTEPEPTVPTYIDPVVLAEVEGAGNTVTDNYELPACGKAVFYWEVEASSYGSASIIINLHNVAADSEKGLVNEFAMDVDGSFTGSTLQPLKGGEYFFSTENTDEPWKIRVECQDGVAPVAEGMDVSGTGDSVTENFTLHACRKSVFHWSVEPTSSRTASIIIRLCNAGDVKTEGCPSPIANEFEMDIPESLEGEALQRVDDGDYFLTISNTDQDWHIWWECRD